MMKILYHRDRGAASARRFPCTAVGFLPLAFYPTDPHAGVYDMETLGSSRGFADRSEAHRAVWGPQLFDRNSQRPFAPPSAFVAEGLDSDRFLAEMRVAASAPAGLMDLANSRVAGVLRCLRMLWCLPGPTHTHTQPS